MNGGQVCISLKYHLSNDLIRIIQKYMINNISGNKIIRDIKCLTNDDNWMIPDISMVNRLKYINGMFYHLG